MTNQQIVQIVFFVIVFGFSGISWIIKKLKDQADLRRAEMNRERRRLEALRTGRPVQEEPAGLPAPGQARQDLAKHRAAQLQELRRLQQARQRATSGQGAPARSATPPGDPRSTRRVAVSLPGSGGPVVPGMRNPRAGKPPVIPPSTRRAGPAARTAPDQAEYNDRRARQDDKRARQVEKSGLAQRIEDAQKTKDREELATAGAAAALLAKHTAAEAQSRAYARPSLPTAFFAGMSRDDWRRAILAKEILGPPVGFRQTAGPGPSPLGPGT